MVQESTVVTANSEEVWRVTSRVIHRVQSSRRPRDIFPPRPIFGNRVGYSGVHTLIAQENPV